jgi:small subunit ribosomal protein S18
MVTGQGKMYSRKRSGNCAKHQRQAQQAVKQARFIGLLTYIG